jgi:hypothetical protein
MCAQTVAPNIARAAGRADPNAAVLGSLACLLDTPEWIGTPQRRGSRMPAGDVVIEIDVASFTDQVRQMCCTTQLHQAQCRAAGGCAGLHNDCQVCWHVHVRVVKHVLDLPQAHGERRGKMLGVLDRLQHIQSCGATTVMLRPLTASGPGALLLVQYRRHACCLGEAQCQAWKGKARLQSRLRMAAWRGCRLGSERARPAQLLRTGAVACGGHRPPGASA